MSSESFELPSLEYLGEKLPQYAFQAFIAQGGMGAVYKARQISLERDVAIKVLPHGYKDNVEFRESFAKEAKAMARLNHPNLIGVFDFGEVDGVPYIVMEYIEGCSLHESAWGRAIDPAQAAGIIRSICEGLADAHENGIIHRDIKPANILLTTKAVPKIGDFGLAHSMGSDHSGIVMGTPGYTAPEIYTDANLAGPLADIYSVGMILHQLLTGVDPSEHPQPTQLCGNARLDAIWRKATRPNPADRYQTVAQIAADLRKWLDGNADVASKSTGSVPRAVQPNRPAPAAMPAASSVSNGSSLGLKMAAVVFGLIAVGFGIKYFRHQDSSGDPVPPITSQPPAIPPAPATQPKRPDSTPRRNPAPSNTLGTRTSPGSVTSHSTVPSHPDPVIVEHSPSPSHPDPGSSADLSPGDPALRDRAAALIGDARKKRDALVLKNAKVLQSVLKGRARTAERSDADFLNQFAEACECGWLPEPETMPELSAAVDAAYQRAHREQVSIESAHQVELARIRDFYVPKLKQAADAASDPQLKRRLLAQADSAADLADWVEKLAPEPPRKVASVRAPNLGFVGHWDFTSDKATQWIADANGVVTVNDGRWKGNTAPWKIRPDGGVEIAWPGKKADVLYPDGKGWKGKTGYGIPATAAPGNW